MFNLLILLKKVEVMFDYFPGKFSYKYLFIQLNSFIFLSMHVSGERLGQLTGIAAILRFPMPDLDLTDEHHHHHEMNSEVQEIDNDDLQPNPNRTVNHFDHTDEDRTTNNDQTLNENRAEASAW